MNKVFTLLTSVLVLNFAVAQSKSTKTAKPVAKKAETTATLSTKTTETKSDGGHNIKITLTPAVNQKAYLGCYYGKVNIIVDSCMLNDKCVGYFKGDKKLTGGIYFVVTQSHKMLSEVLIGNEQNFTIVGDTLQKESFKITGSSDNDIFKEHNKKAEIAGKSLSTIESRLKEAKNKADTMALVDEEKKTRKELAALRDDVIKKYPNSLVATLFVALKEPETPQTYINPETQKIDSLYPYYYVKDHFFDNINFADERLLRTPFFEKKIDNYLKYYVSTEADSIIPEIKFMLLSARDSKEMYSYLLTKFTNKYLNPEYMGQDKVFVHLFTDYYLRGDTSLLDAKSRKTIIDRGYNMMLGLIGNVASPLDLTDAFDGKTQTLYSLKNKFTVVAYWDPTCGHCRQEIPQLDSIYKAKWKNEDVKVYSIISKEDLLAELKKFKQEKNLSDDWIYVYETKAAREATEKAMIPNFRQAYDFNKTPIFYILDADKRIIGKHLTIHQIDDLIDRKIKAMKK